MSVNRTKKTRLPLWMPEASVDNGQMKTWDALFQNPADKKVVCIDNIHSVFMWEALADGRRQAAKILGCAEGALISVRCVRTLEKDE